MHFIHFIDPIAYRREALLHPLRQPRRPLAEVGTLALQIVRRPSQPLQGLAAEAGAPVAQLDELGELGLLLLCPPLLRRRRRLRGWR